MFANMRQLPKDAESTIFHSETQKAAVLRFIRDSPEFYPYRRSLPTACTDPVFFDAIFEVPNITETGERLAPLEQVNLC